MASLNSPVNVAPGVNGGFSRMTAAAYNAMLLRAAAEQPGAPGSRTGQKGRKGPKRASPEEDLHRLVFDWITAMENIHPVLKFMFHSPNGGARSKGEAGKLRAMGTRKGISDFINPFPNGVWPGFACELKAPKGRLTPEQAEFLQQAHLSGWVTGVCFTLDEFIALTEVYLGLRPSFRNVASIRWA